MEQKNIHDIAWIYARIASIIIIPIFLLIGGHMFTSSQQEKVISLKYIELGLDLLSEPPEKTNKPIRLWAVDLINSYSKINIPPEARKEIIETYSLPKSTAEIDNYRMEDLHERYRKLITLQGEIRKMISDYNGPRFSEKGIERLRGKMEGGKRIDDYIMDDM